VTRSAALLLDEMLSADIAIQLRERGYDAIAVVEVAGLISSSDEDLLLEATAQQRCLVTANVRDFAAISAQWNRLGRVHAGIVHVVSVAFPQNRSYIGALVTALDAAATAGEIPSRGSELFLRRA
jgi:predicted nuclease of predicted toxin-antitoxin system